MRHLLWIAVAAALVVAGATPSRSGAGHRTGTEGTLYEVTLTGTGQVTVNGSDPAIPLEKYNTSTLSASWTFKSAPTRLWIAKYHGDIRNSIVTKASASASGTNGGSNRITAHETFTYYDHDHPNNPLLGTSDCTATVKNDVAAEYKAESTNAGVSLDVDLSGAFRTDKGAEVPCQSQGERGPGQPVDGDYSGFLFAWDPTAAPARDNQQMQLGATLHPFQIGLPSISPILTDQSHVTWATNCTGLDLTTCSVTFKLDGQLEMHRICSGTIGSCGGQGGGTKTPPKGPAAAKPPVITGLKVTPASFPLGDTNVKVSYHDSEPGSTTLIEVLGSIAGHSVPIAVVQHLDTSGAVVVPLPHALVPALAFKPGKFQLQAKAVSKTTGPGNTATTTFVITR